MLPRKLDKKSYEKETVEYSIKSFHMKFMYAEHTEDGWSGFIPHAHEEMEFLYVVRGEAEVSVNSTKYRAKPGDIFVFNCDEIHSCMKTFPGYQTFCIQFRPSFLSSNMMDICEYNYIRPLIEKSARFKNYYENELSLKLIFAECEKEYREKSEGYHIALKGYIYAFLSRLYRLNPHLKTGTISNEKHSNYERVNSIITHIAANYIEPIEFKKLVSDMHLDYSYFSRIFKAQTGKSMLRYLNEYRLTIALNLLSNTNKNITEIALSCGFDDLNYFSRSFKQLIGLSPTKIKKVNPSSG